MISHLPDPGQANPESALASELRPILGRLPAGQRGPIMNAFLAPIRTGETDPHKIVQIALARLKNQLQRRASWRPADAHEALRQAIMTIISHPSETLMLAEEAIAYERLPQAEKDRLKAQRGERYRQEHMATLPPTRRQIAYLHALGHQGPVKSRLQASQLIDALLAKKGETHA
jgi:hypothetical protein